MDVANPETKQNVMSSKQMWGRQRNRKRNNEACKKPCNEGCLGYLPGSSEKDHCSPEQDSKSNVLFWSSMSVWFPPVVSTLLWWRAADHAQPRIRSFPMVRSLREVPELKTDESRPYSLTTCMKRLDTACFRLLFTPNRLSLCNSRCTKMSAMVSSGNEIQQFLAFSVTSV